MNLQQVLYEIDTDIAKLKAARNVLATDTKPVGKVTAAAATPAKKKKRKLTPDGRLRIAEAVRRRWAKQKKST
jgi:hypothetical protein